MNTPVVQNSQAMAAISNQRAHAVTRSSSGEADQQKRTQPEFSDLLASLSTSQIADGESDASQNNKSTNSDAELTSNLGETQASSEPEVPENNTNTDAAISGINAKARSAKPLSSDEFSLDETRSNLTVEQNMIAPKTETGSLANSTHLNGSRDHMDQGTPPFEKHLVEIKEGMFFARSTQDFPNTSTDQQGDVSSRTGLLTLPQLTQAVEKPASQVSEISKADSRQDAPTLVTSSSKRQFNIAPDPDNVAQMPALQKMVSSTDAPDQLIGTSKPAAKVSAQADDASNFETALRKGKTEVELTTTSRHKSVPNTVQETLRQIPSSATPVYSHQTKQTTNLNGPSEDQPTTSQAKHSGVAGQKKNPPIPVLRISSAQNFNPSGAAQQTSTGSDHVGAPAHGYQPMLNQAYSAVTLNAASATTTNAAGQFTAEMVKIDAAKKGDGASAVLATSDTAEMFVWDSGKPLTASNNVAQPLRADLAPQVARQLVEVFAQAAHKPVEIALSPHELGRVRMSIVAEDGSITVNIVAERSDTLDLMRRNIDQLGQTFRSMGYEQISFAFGQGNESGEQTGNNKINDPADTDTAQHDSANQSSGDTPAVIHLNNPPTSGVDIRL